MIYFAVFLRVSPSYQVGVTFNGISNATASCTVLCFLPEIMALWGHYSIYASLCTSQHTQTHT